MWSFLKKLRQAAKGATAVEYGLLLALIAIIIMGSVSLLGQNVNQTLDSTAQALSSSGSDRGSGGGEAMAAEAVLTPEAEAVLTPAEGLVGGTLGVRTYLAGQLISHDYFLVLAKLKF